ncbi:MAG: hypothetical protein LBU89_00955 [Fibromonadaceae bacterium]|nr:hypothetical protein [Fibromonadaceae bacterium]
MNFFHAHEVQQRSPNRFHRSHVPSFFLLAFNSHFSGIVAGKSGVGGLVGNHAFTTMNNCYFIGEVKSESNVGWLVGQNYSSTSNTVKAL